MDYTRLYAELAAREFPYHEIRVSWKCGGLPLVTRLMEQNVQVCFRYYKSADRELGHVFHCNMRLEEATRCNDDECAFFSSLV